MKTWKPVPPAATDTLHLSVTLRMDRETRRKLEDDVSAQDALELRIAEAVGHLTEQHEPLDHLGVVEVTVHGSFDIPF
jgi:hypothetical protein